MYIERLVDKVISSDKMPDLSYGRLELYHFLFEWRQKRKRNTLTDAHRSVYVCRQGEGNMNLKNTF